VARAQEAVDEYAEGPPCASASHSSAGPEARHTIDERRIGLVVILAPHVGDHLRNGVGDAARPLPAGLARGDEAGRERRRAGGPGVALEHEHPGAGVVCRKCRDETAGARTNHEDRHVELEAPRPVDHHHIRPLSSRPYQELLEIPDRSISCNDARAPRFARGSVGRSRHPDESAAVATYSSSDCATNSANPIRFKSHCRALA
jgi:hypothetical protein